MESSEKFYSEDLYVRAISLVHSSATEADKNVPLPYVSLTYKEHESKLSVSQARNLAKSIYLAVAYAENDAALFANKFPTRMGFKLNPKESQQQLEKEMKQLRKVRSQRQPLPGGVSPVLGHKTQLPFVELPIGSSTQRIDIQTASSLATWLLEAAESGEYDILFQRFMTQQIEVEPEKIAFILIEFQLYRQQNRLENALNISEMAS